MSGLLAFSPGEIVETFESYGRLPVQAEIDALIGGSRIDPWALAGAPGSGEACIRFATIERLADGRFDYTIGEGELAMTILARDLFGDPADIVATKRDGYLAPWIGAVSAIGLHTVLAPRIGDRHLTVHMSAFDWLRAGRSGVVLIDEDRAATELRSYGPYRAAGGVPHGLHLQRLFTPRLPEIVVPAAHAAERRAA
jgi:hypothetical protein